MELIKITDKTYYIKNNTNIGIYKLDDTNVCIIDTGNDKDAGKKIIKIIEEQGWHIKSIINTHSNADHIGGNEVIQNRTNCQIFTSNIEKSITENPLLEPAILYGSNPFKDLKNKFLMAKESHVENIDSANIEGLEIIPLKGHFFNMIGVKTSDDIYFLADSLFSEETIDKYHLFFIYDVKEYLNTLDYLSTLKGKLFIPSHSSATTNIDNLIEINRKKVNEIINIIYNFCETEITFEDIEQNIFSKYNLTININQYYLIGSTIKSYLSYLYEEGKITYIFKDNKMYWHQL